LRDAGRGMSAAHVLEMGAEPLAGASGRALLGASVWNVTRNTGQASNAWVSCSSLAWVLIPVRSADAVYQVLPMSSTDGGRSSDGSGPWPTPGGYGGGQLNTSISRAPAVSWTPQIPSIGDHRPARRQPARPLINRGGAVLSLNLWDDRFPQIGRRPSGEPHSGYR